LGIIPLVTKSLIHIDTAGIGQLATPLEKLVDAVGEFVGKVYEPTNIRRKAKAQVEAKLIRAEGVAELSQRAACRLGATELRRQENIEAIVEEAKACLPSTVSDKSVDRDWTARFFSECQDVSAPELRSLWGKLLASEVATPDKIAPSTLSVLRNMTRKDAELFAKAAGYAWGYNESDALITRCILDPMGKSALEPALTYDDVLPLDALGLVSSDANITQPIEDSDLDGGAVLRWCGYEYILIPKSVGASMMPPAVEIFPLTLAGHQLLACTSATADERVFQASLAAMQWRGVTLASIWPRRNGASIAPESV
jgi:hypothetical protein